MKCTIVVVISRKSWPPRKRRCAET